VSARQVARWLDQRELGALHPPIAIARALRGLVQRQVLVIEGRPRWLRPPRVVTR